MPKVIASAALVIMWGWPPAGSATPVGQITVLAGQASGDYGTDSDTERQSATVRLVYGDKTRLRLDLGMVRANSDVGVTQTPFGLVPTQTRKGPQGSTGAGGNGQGSSPGATAPTLPAGPSSPPSAVTDWATGPGDLRLTLSQRLLGDGASLFRLDAEIGAKLPTADEQDGLGTGEWDYRLGAAAQYRFWSVTAFGGLGWNALGDPDWVELRDVLDVYAGVESQPLAERIIVSGWLEGNEEVVAGTGSRSALGLGIRSTGKVRWRAQFSAGLGGSAEDFSALLGVSFGVSTPTIGSRKVG